MLIMPIVIMTMADGEDKAYMEALYRTHYRLMFATAWKYLSEKAEVEDVVSDGCVALIKNISTLRGLAGNALKVYIVSTIRNTAFNHINKQNTRTRYEVDTDDEAINMVSSTADVEHRIVLEDELKCVMQVIERLPEKERLIMRMKFVLEMDYKTIALQIGLSEESVHKYISRARAKIKAAIYARSEAHEC